MRKVELNMTEEFKYNVIKRLVETNGNKKTASLKLDCSVRTVNRLIKGYKKHGKVFFQHGNKGRKPVNAIDQVTKQEIITLYDNKYHGSNHTHFAELLQKHEGIKVSSTFLRELFLEQNILSPLATKKVKKNLKKKLQDEMVLTTSKIEQRRIQEQILSIEECHPRRARCAYFGEMIQMDAAVFIWFGETKLYLHIAVDDCTGTLVGAFFAPQETLVGYYNVLYQILTTYGIPYMFYTDKRTVFEYKKKGNIAVENDTFTQFGYACKQLGIEIKTTSVPQAKGRVERMVGTLKSRLPVELRLAGVTTIEQANEFLHLYVKEFNAKFALSINHNKSVFEKQPNLEQINLILATISKRKIDAGHSLRFSKKYFLPVKENGTPIYYLKGTSALVIRAFDNRLFAVINDTVFGLEEIPEHERFSKNFDLPKPIEKPKKRYIPPMSHPWKEAEFNKHLNAQPHRDIPPEVTFEDLWHTDAAYL